MILFQDKSSPNSTETFFRQFVPHRSNDYPLIALISSSFHVCVERVVNLGGAVSH